MTQKTHRTSPAVVRGAAAALAALTGIGLYAACQGLAEPPPTPANAAAVLGANGTRTRGGITYDPAIPLDAIVTPTFDPASQAGAASFDEHRTRVKQFFDAGPLAL